MNAPLGSEWRATNEWPLREEARSDFHFHPGPCDRADSINDGVLAKPVPNNDGHDEYTVDYTTSGGIRGLYPEVRTWLAKALSAFSMTQHMISNSLVQIAGDRATARTMVFNPMGSDTPEGKLHLFYVGAYYNDELVRTPDGWRIAVRIEEQAYFDGRPPKGLKIPE